MTSERQPVVELEDVVRTYRMGTNEVHALAGLTWQVCPGSFWAVMGPSGSGKSTLLNLLGCLDRPTTGRYLFEGREVGRLDDDELSELRLRRLGFIFQSFNLISQLTVRENIELPLFYLGWDPDESAARAAKLAEKVGLADRLDHRPSELSGGQQQRVAVARSMVNDPAILLADEPTGNLDTATSGQIMEILSDLNASGKTVILVTHETEIAAWASSRLHMRDGVAERIEEDGA
mgnify:CR=1 FL=1